MDEVANACFAFVNEFNRNNMTSQFIEYFMNGFLEYKHEIYTILYEYLQNHSYS